MYQFFALIIGTEILNKRREDKHFDFVTKELLNKGYKLTGSFIIEDKPKLINDTIFFLEKQENSIVFSFGGIGGTPDDHTRKCASIALSDGELYLHKEAKEKIEDKLKTRAYPHAINMAYLPKNATLIENSFNGIPAFSLNNRFFFMPGFPEMSHPMVENIINQLIPISKKIYRYTLIASCGESSLINFMKTVPKDIELSSLPKNNKDGSRSVTISLSSENREKTLKEFEKCKKVLKEKEINFNIENN